MIKIGKVDIINKHISNCDYSQLLSSDKQNIIILGGNGTLKSSTALSYASTIVNAIPFLDKDEINSQINLLSGHYHFYDKKINDHFISTLIEIIHNRHNISDYDSYSEGEENVFNTQTAFKTSDHDLKTQIITHLLLKGAVSQQFLYHILGDLGSKKEYQGYSLEQFAKIANPKTRDTFDQLFRDCEQLAQSILGELLITRDISSFNPKLTLINHCFGTIIATLLEDSLISILVKNNFSNKEIKEICHKINNINIASPVYVCDSKFNNFYLGSSNDDIFKNSIDISDHYSQLSNNSIMPDSYRIITSDKSLEKPHNIKNFILNNRNNDPKLSQALSIILYSIMKNNFSHLPTTLRDIPYTDETFQNILSK